ncbi:hypothetical protein V5F90_03235 [Priestia aryabhattai]
MEHIVFYSGGIGSWMTANRVIEKHGKNDIVLLFTDTLIEDKDLYRFMLDTFQNTFSSDVAFLKKKINKLPDIRPEMTEEDWLKRKTILIEVSQIVNKMYPQVTWIADERTPWEVFKDTRFLGNSRLAKCSHLLKQDTARKWLESSYKPDECVLYLGIDWTEMHRTKSPVKNWAPYKVEFPMTKRPYLAKQEMLNELKRDGIEVPILYKLGFSHNNCSGMCIRGGQGHFVNLIKYFPERFDWLEQYEKDMRTYLGSDVSILSKQISDGFKLKEVSGELIKVPQYKKIPFTLSEFKEEYKRGGEQLDLFDFGGCGCMIDY